MNKQKILLTLVLFLLVVGGVILYQSLRTENAKSPNTVVALPFTIQEGSKPWISMEDCVKNFSLSTSTWKVFENKKYGYTISYPSEGYINSRNDSTLNLSEEPTVEIGICNGFTLGGVDAIIYPNYPTQETEKAGALNLKSYAEAVRMIQINDSTANPYFKNRNVGMLKETTIDGRKAYQFTLDKGFTTSAKIYGIPYGGVNMYIITENLKGQKIIISYYLGNPIAEKMYRTFVFK